MAYAEFVPISCFTLCGFVPIDYVVVLLYCSMNAKGGHYNMDSCNWDSICDNLNSVVTLKLLVTL